MEGNKLASFKILVERFIIRRSCVMVLNSFNTGISFLQAKFDLENRNADIFCRNVPKLSK